MSSLAITGQSHSALSQQTPGILRPISVFRIWCRAVSHPHALHQATLSTIVTLSTKQRSPLSSRSPPSNALHYRHALHQPALSTTPCSCYKCLGVWMFACVWYANSAETLSICIRLTGGLKQQISNLMIYPRRPCCAPPRALRHPELSTAPRSTTPHSTTPRSSPPRARVLSVCAFVVLGVWVFGCLGVMRISILPKLCQIASD
jgi:hypothetical protein